jgi:hypothetical protein
MITPWSKEQHLQAAQEGLDSLVVGRTIVKAEVTEEGTKLIFDNESYYWWNNLGNVDPKLFEIAAESDAVKEWKKIAKRFEQAALDNETAYKLLLADYNKLLGEACRAL